MSMAWIVVADAARARIFSSGQNTSSMKEIETLNNPEGRMHEQELTSDLPGRTFDSAGEGRHAMGKAVDPKKHATIDFAKSIASHLDNARSQNKFSTLVFIAAPAMLGHLREALNAETKKLVIEEIDKDLTQHSEEDIRSHLPEHLRG
jgi:protein required for attachment to host cells